MVRVLVKLVHLMQVLVPHWQMRLGLIVLKRLQAIAGCVPSESFLRP
jgi:hypothetical protein